MPNLVDGAVHGLGELAVGPDRLLLQEARDFRGRVEEVAVRHLGLVARGEHCGDARGVEARHLRAWGNEEMRGGSGVQVGMRFRGRQADVLSEHSDSPVLRLAASGLPPPRGWQSPQAPGSLQQFRSGSTTAARRGAAPSPFAGSALSSPSLSQLLSCSFVSMLLSNWALEWSPRRVTELGLAVGRQPGCKSV